MKEENLEGYAPEGIEKVYAVIDEGADTRTSLSDDLKVLWSEGDAIVTFFGKTTRQKFVIDSECAGSNEGSFTKDSEYIHPGSGSTIEDNIAFYPFCEPSCKAVDGGYTLTGIILPEVQEYVHDSFAEGAFPMIAVTEDTGDYNFCFKNLCGALMLQLTGTVTVKELKLTGNAGEKLSGKAVAYGFHDNHNPQIVMQEDAKESVSLDCGSGVQLNEAAATTFIFSLPPVDFEKGFTVTIVTADGKTGTLSTEKKNPVVRSRMLQMPVIPFEVSGPVLAEGDYYDEYGINHGPGVEIDGVIWAPVNCGYHETDYKWGKLYQWGRRSGFGYNDGNEYIDATCPTTTISGLLFINEAQSRYYDNTFFTGASHPQSRRHVWAYEEVIEWPCDPCPEGWHLPDRQDLYKIYENRSQYTIHNGVTGYWFSGTQEYSEEVPRVFLPSSGTISNNGNPDQRCEAGYYWSRSNESGVLCTESQSTSDHSLLNANSVRCVRYPEEAYVYTTEVTLSKSELSMENHSTEQLTATVTNSSGATSNYVIWDTEDHDIARVDAGLVTAVGEGVTRIMAKSGNICVYCSVTVTPRKKHEGDYIDEYGINHGPGTKIGSITWAPVNCGHHEEEAPGGKYYQWGRRFGQYKGGQMEGPVDLVEYQDEEYKDYYFNGGLNTWRNELWTNEYKSEYDPCPEGWTVPGNYYMFNELTSRIAEVVRYGNKVLLAYGNNYPNAYTPSIELQKDQWYWTAQSDNETKSALSFIIMEVYPYSQPYEKQYSNKVRCIKGGSVIPVTDLQLMKSSLSLTVRESATLKAAVSPSSPSHKYIEWSSDHPAVASVDANGKVTAKSPGKATIRAMAGLKVDECVVTVSSSPYAVKYIDENGIDQGEGTDIDGVIWAPVNCGFHETDFPWGKLYQGGRFYGQGYSDDQYSDAVTPQVSSSGYYGEDNENNANTFFAGSSYYIDESDWNAGTDSAPVKGAHDPCPEGWRVPTSTEMASLTANYSRETGNNSLGQNGIWCSGSRPCTEKELRVFLPMAGTRTTKGNADTRGEYGYYWTSEADYSGYMTTYYLNAYSSFANLQATDRHAQNGNSIRCVQEDPDAIMIQATGLSIGAGELNLAPGASHTFSQVFTPANATTRKIRWSTSDEFVAKIENGRLTAVSEGTAVITAKVGTVKATCTVTVTPRYQEGYYIDQYGVNHGEGINIDGKIWAPVNCGYEATYSPNGKYYQWGRKYGQVYHSYGSSMNSVTEEGPVSLEQGEASHNRNIFYTDQSYPYNWLEPFDATLWNSGSEEHPVKSEYDPCPKGWRVPTRTEMDALLANASSEMTVSSRKGKYYSGSNGYSNKVTSLFLAHTSWMYADRGSTSSMSDASSYQTSTHDPNSVGHGFSLRCIKDTDQLADIPVTGLEADISVKVLKGETRGIPVKIYPANATDRSYSLTSSNTSIVRVEGNKIIGVSDGEAIVTVTCGKFSAQCNVKVWSLRDYISSSGKNHGKGTYIAGTAWAPVDAGQYVFLADINDCCPDGWRVPTSNEFTTLTAHRSATFSSGCWFSGNVSYNEEVPSVWLSASGREYFGEDADDPVVQYVGKTGYYWTSNRSGYGAYVLEFNSEYAHIIGLSGFEYYCSVRCVQDE